MKNIATCFFLVLLSSCSVSYVELYKTKSNLNNVDNKMYVFENDTVKISYTFWNQRGVMYFTIYNKLSVPVYVDWKKSSFILDSYKFNYWNDDVNTKTSTSSVEKLYLYRGNPYNPNSGIYGSSESQTTTSRPERVTFIPPNSKIDKSSYFILQKGRRNYNGYEKLTERRNDNNKKSTTIYKKEFNINNSPKVFRNFVTFSTSENFNTEFNVDNNFYVSEILIMDERHFSFAIFGTLERKYFYFNGCDFYRRPN